MRQRVIPATALLTIRKKHVYCKRQTALEYGGHGTLFAFFVLFFCHRLVLINDVGFEHAIYF